MPINTSKLTDVVATASIAAKHFKEQGIQKQVNRLGAQKELETAQTAASNNTNDLVAKYSKGKSPEELQPKEVETERPSGDFVGPMPARVETPEESQERLISEGQTARTNEIQEEINNAYAEVGMASSPIEKELANEKLEKAKEALNELNNEVTARRALKFDVEMAKEKVKLYGGKK